MSLVNETINRLKLPKEMTNDIRYHILTTHSLKKLQQEFGEFNRNLSVNMKTLVRVKIFSKALKGSELSYFLKISLYKAWLEDQKTNKSLINAG